MSGSETTEGFIANPYAIDNTIDDQDSIVASNREKHGPRKEYKWYCSFRDLESAERQIKGLNCNSNYFQCKIQRFH